MTTNYDLRTITTAGLVRLYRRAWERMTAGDGYQPYGYDRPTLAATVPGWLAVLDAIRAEASRR
jgi:hypothetical protein